MIPLFASLELLIRFSQTCSSFSYLTFQFVAEIFVISDVENSAVHFFRFSIIIVNDLAIDPHPLDGTIRPYELRLVRKSALRKRLLVCVGAHDLIILAKPVTE